MRKRFRRPVDLAHQCGKRRREEFELPREAW
jgi:hypothetical protein